MLFRSPSIQRLTLCALLSLAVAGCGKSTDPQVSDPPPETQAAAPAPANAAMDATPVAEATPESAPVTPAPAPTPTQEAATPAEDWLIVPGERVGKITATSTAADLIAAYGAENVKDTEFFLGEGETEMGTGLFLDDETKTVRILWMDSENKATPATVELTGAKSVWKTAEGISLGTPLTKVQEINGKPFKLYGFEWDYGGSLSEGNNGNIKGLPHEDPEKGFQPVFFGLTFQPDYDAKPDFPQEKYSQVAGDTEFSSDHAVMQELDPVIYAITVSFPEAWE